MIQNKITALLKAMNLTISNNQMVQDCCLKSNILSPCKNSQFMCTKHCFYVIYERNFPSVYIAEYQEGFFA